MDNLAAPREAPRRDRRRAREQSPARCIPPRMRSTKIVATIGPASRDPDVLERMVGAGMDVARLNFAHGSADEHAETVRRVRAAAEAAGREVAVLQDIPGPKLRLGPVAGELTLLETGSHLVLTPEQVEGDATRLPVAWPGFAELVGDGDVVYLADGAIRLRVRQVRNPDVEVEVEVGGAVASRQGLNLPNVTMSLPAVSDEDLRMIDAGVEMGVDLMALSFIRRGDDLRPVRERLAAHGSDIPVIAKIEKPQAAANAEEVVEAADGIMVARGDLGIELPIEQVPLVQKRLLHVAGQKAKPCITATQMLESMVSSTRPTRAEVADVANAIFDGTDAVMLSQETAIGRDPPGAVEMMAAIARATEDELPYWRLLTERGLRGGDDPASIAFGAVGAVYQLGLKVLVCPTQTGKTARLISSHRPQVPTLALSPRIEVVRRCSIYWGVCALRMDEPHDTTELLAACEHAAVEAGLCSSGDKIGITAGLPAGVAGGTNLFKVQQVA
ncbi:MAG: pyruvate kinase [Actinobacteria bacterium]|nr:pyruvate kinase [Actinomycetota bacterium]